MLIREFEKPNTSFGFECPICKSGKIAPVVLVPIPGTEDGDLCEAGQVHSECFELHCKMHDIQLTIERCKK